MLSERIRANVEAAPWVIDEIKKMEQEIESLKTSNAIFRKICPSCKQPLKLFYSRDADDTGYECSMCKMVYDKNC